MRADEARDESLAGAIDDGDTSGGGRRGRADGLDKAGGEFDVHVLARGPPGAVDDGRVAQQGRLLGGGRERGSGEGEGEAFAHGVLDALAIVEVLTGFNDPFFDI